MPSPNFLNITSTKAAQADKTEPVRRTHSLVSRQRAMRGDFTDGTPLALIPTQLDLSVNPTHDDTVTVDGEVYQFKLVATDTVVTNDAYIGVEILASAALTFPTFLAALNGTAAESANLTLADAVTPALYNGTKAVFAADLGTQVAGLYYTGTQNRDPALMTHDDYAVFPTAYPSFVVASSLTSAEVWTILNFNLLPTANSAKEVNGMVGLRLDVVTALLDVPFRVTFAGGTDLIGCVVSPKSATGVPVYWDTATFNVSGGDLLVDLDTGGAVDPANGEFVDIILFGQFAGVQA